MRWEVWAKGKGKEGPPRGLESRKISMGHMELLLLWAPCFAVLRGVNPRTPWNLPTTL